MLSEGNPAAETADGDEGVGPPPPVPDIGMSLVLVCNAATGPDADGGVGVVIADGLLIGDALVGVGCEERRKTIVIFVRVLNYIPPSYALVFDYS